MSAPKFTPGPWFVKDDPALMIVAREGCPVVAELCAIERSEGNEEFANASLIAAAPELYEALESIAEYWNRDRNEDAMHDACWHAVNTAADALAKARGEVA